MNSKRTKEDRWASIGKTAAGSGILGGLATLASLSKKGLSPKDLVSKSGSGALAGAMLGGLWKGGTEVGGALDDDDYTGRILGGLVGGGPIGGGLSALDTYLLKRKMENK